MNAEPDLLKHLSDEELLTRFREGQKPFFGVLVRRYQRELFGYLRRYLRDSELAEDVFQATFLQVYLRSDQYEAGRPVRPWLYRIAIHQAIDVLRKVGRHPMLSLDAAGGDASEGESRSLVDLLESRETDPVEQLQNEERRELVRAEIEKLPEFLRQVVLLAYYQGLKYREIADILDIPVGTIKSRLHTALLRLQESLSQMPSLPEM